MDPIEPVQPTPPRIAAVDATPVQMTAQERERRREQLAKREAERRRREQQEREREELAALPSVVIDEELLGHERAADTDGGAAPAAGEREGPAIDFTV